MHAAAIGEVKLQMRAAAIGEVKLQMRAAARKCSSAACRRGFFSDNFSFAAARREGSFAAARREGSFAASRMERSFCSGKKGR